MQYRKSYACLQQTGSNGLKETGPNNPLLQQSNIPLIHFLILACPVKEVLK